jgi:hypothetical protein
MIRKTATIELEYVALSHFDWKPGMYVVVHGGAYIDLIYCDGTVFLTEEATFNNHNIFPYSDEIEWLAKWDGFPMPNVTIRSQDSYN